MSSDLNYKHLYYFWVAAKEGGMSHAAARLNMAVQTISAQVRQLEKDLGYSLFKPAGRGLTLTEAGEAALQMAEQIFQIGEQLPAAVRDAANHGGLRLTVGMSDGLPKLAVRDLLSPVVGEPGLRLQCHEGEFDDLLADLALHRLDVVLADRPAPANPNLRLYSHPMGAWAMGWYAPAALAEAATHGGAANFPAVLATVPVLLPTAHSTIRLRLDQWFERHGIAPKLAGEFEDSALLTTFAASGLGLLPAPVRMREQLEKSYGLVWVGPCDGVQEHFFAIGTARRVQHPLVQRLLTAEVD